MSKISVQSHPTEKAQHLGMQGVKVKVTLVQEWVVKVLVEMETLGKEGVKDLVVMDFWNRRRRRRRNRSWFLLGCKGRCVWRWVCKTRNWGRCIWRSNWCLWKRD
jgi:hypothetical protein